MNPINLLILSESIKEPAPSIPQILLAIVYWDTIGRESWID